MLHFIKGEQYTNFGDVLDFLRNSSKVKMPPIVGQLDLFLDKQDVIRVGSKLNRKDSFVRRFCPILLPNGSNLTTLIIKKSAF